MTKPIRSQEGLQQRMYWAFNRVFDISTGKQIKEFSKESKISILIDDGKVYQLLPGQPVKTRVRNPNGRTPFKSKEFLAAVKNVKKGLSRETKKKL